MKMRAKIAAAAAVFCALGATAVFAEEFPGAAFIPIPETPITLQNPYVRKPVNPSDGGSSGGELSPNLLPWTGSPPSSIPCNPPSKFCSTRISNAPYCTGYTKAKVGMTCADVTRLFGLWDDYTAWINPDVDCSKPIPAGKNICVSGWFGFIPDDPSFSKGQKYPPVYGKSYQYCKKAGQMALTFDDGPHTFTPELLDFLKKEKVKATFFVNGMNHNCIYNATYVAMVRRAFNEGHQIASHSWSHPSLRGIYDTYKAKFGEAAGKDAVTAELERLERAFERIIGRRPKWLRPPFGEGGHDPVLEPIFRERGYMIAMWTFATLDANLWVNSDGRLIGSC